MTHGHTEKFVAESRRPLVLAERLRSGKPLRLVSLDGRTDVRDEMVVRREFFAGTVPVVLDSVSDWLDQASGDRWPDARLVPNYRLPWPNVWVEYRDHAAEASAQSTGPIHQGLLLRESRVRDWLKSYPQLNDSRLDGDAHYGVMVTSITWLSGPDRFFSPPPIMFFSDEYGRSVSLVPPSTEGDAGTSYVVLHSKNGTVACPRGMEALWGRVVWDATVVWRIFTAWLQVKNTSVVAVTLDRAARRRAERCAVADQGAPPWIKYKSLALTLPREEGAGRERVSDGPPSPVPFHLVRGHLADYRKGPGLFGKWRSVVWVPMHKRGMQRAGCVAKSYEARIEEQ